MKRVLPLFVAICFAVIGCGEATPTGPVNTDGDEAASTPEVSTTDTPKADPVTTEAPGDAKEASDAKVAGNDVALTPENTKIEFVGTHVGEKPDPRKGHFEKFSGTAKVDEGKLTALTVDIDTTSLATEIDKLTNHLKSPDFFNVKEFPKATFKTTKIEPGEEGKLKVTGDLTLLGETKSITFPATVSSENGLELDAQFKINREEFGMTYSLDKVERDVSMSIHVGK